MAKRMFDLVFSFIVLSLAMPVLVPIMVLIWMQDFHSPLYASHRIGKGGRHFLFFKIRTMVPDESLAFVDTTTARDPRITAVGHLVRAYKLDELPQFVNVLRGHMSIVGPRPNVKRETDLYTEEERKLLSVKPGITDMASIMFSNLAERLSESKDPNLDYNQLIRPWKSRLGLLYVENQSFWLDLEVVGLTAMSFISRSEAVMGVAKILKRIGAPNEVQQIVLGERTLSPHPPPGSDQIVMSRRP